MSVRPVNLLVFREGRRDISACSAQRHLVDLLRNLPEHPLPDEITKLLLLAGELECGVADSGTTQSTVSPILEKLTDAVSAVLLSGSTRQLSGLAELLDQTQLPDRITISAPEGFAYYALYPLAYADAVSNLTGLGGAVAVIGIRSIGTTLSAIAVASLRALGKTAQRITVRPHGHPYNREIGWSDTELMFLRDSIGKGADLIVVDEGPGLSGSSFLAVAEALANAGVPREKITLLCGHHPDFDRLCAHNAPQRAHQFRWLAVNDAPRLPKRAEEFIGGGQWRNILYSDESSWPAAWTSFERLKYRSASSDGSPRFFKFLGLGHYGDVVFQREHQVSAAGFGPEPRREENGFASYPWIEGRPLSAADLNDLALDRLAAYCAFRASAFPAAIKDLDSLQQMAGHNLGELGFDPAAQLELKHPVIADGCMHPHEWLLTFDGKILKTDSGSHGDDHFFPGPADIAWDLAGTIVEWEMNCAQTEVFLEQYEKLSGDDARRRVVDFVVAYKVFRAAYCHMAANALGESEEGLRLDKEALKYSSYLLPASLAQAV